MQRSFTFLSIALLAAPIYVPASIFLTTERVGDRPFELNAAAAVRLRSSISD